MSAEARFLCPEIRCLKYFCERCWSIAHNMLGLHDHEPMDKNNLHLHTPRKFFLNKKWLPLSPSSSLESPMKLSPVTPNWDDLAGAGGIDEMQALMALEKRFQELKVAIPNKGWFLCVHLKS